MQKIDIVLTTPPFSLRENFGLLDFVGQYGLPMNLLYLASNLKKSGINTKIVDFSYEVKTLQDCAKCIVAYNSDFVGIAVHFTFLVNKALKLAVLIKNINPKIKIIVGGIHFTALPEETMVKCPHIDVGITGEAEESLAEVIHSFRNGKDIKQIKGIIFRDGKKLFQSEYKGLIENVNKLPFPALEMINPSLYSLPLFKEQRKTNISIATSRGCPFACTFCDRTILGREIRLFEIAYLSEMIDNLVNRLNVGYLDIEDENICISKDRFLEICGLLQEKFHKYNITWGCLMRPDSVEIDTGRILYDSGCRNVTFGIESGSKRMLDVYNKRLNLDKLAEKCKIIRRSGIILAGSFIIGGPGEDKGSVADTVALIKKIDLDFMFLWYFIPFPGAEIYSNIEKKGNLVGNYSYRTGQQISFIPDTFSRNQLENGYKLIYRTFYSKPTLAMRILRKYGWRRAFKFCRDIIKYLYNFYQ